MKIHIGQANDEGGIAMPQDLQAGYLNLAIPGSPLGPMGLLSGHRLRDSQETQRAILASQNYRA